MRNAFAARATLAIGLAALLATLAIPVRAQGLIVIDDRPGGRIPHPRPDRIRPQPIALEASKVEARIDGRVATVTLHQTFFNPNPRALEGTYLLPLPTDASIGQFRLTSGGKTFAGELLDRERARTIYEGIVARQRDPALLEFLECGLFKARVFPIPANGRVTLTVGFESILERDGGLTRFALPLSRGRAAAARLAVTIELVGGPLETVYSPSHPVDVHRGDATTRVTYEDRGRRPAGRDFLLYFASAADRFGVHVLTHTAPGEPGFFLAVISPKRMRDRRAEPKDIVLVLDTSGSMKGEKIRQAKEAARYCLRGLDPRDRFNVIGFSTDARPFRPSVVAATPDNVAAGLAFVDRQEALGGTNIHRALITATEGLDDAERVGITIFLTDGLPTVDVVDKEKILAAVRKRNRERNRIFAFGVGTDVNTHLIDRLAEEHRGSRTYVGPGENLEVKLSAFYEKVRYPVLSDLALDLGGAGALDLQPRRLPDLFSGSQLLVLGRFTSPGRHAIRLSGRSGGEARTWTFEADFAANPKRNDYLPRLWAMRKVGYLLDQIRLHGSRAELVDSVVALGKRYGVVTPYTSFLVTEDDLALPPGAPEATVRRLLRDRANREHEAKAAADAALRPQSGGAATRLSTATKRLRGAGVAAPSAEAFDAPGEPGKKGVRREAYRRAGGITFVRLGDMWVDVRYDAESMAKRVERVEAFSDAYFALLRKEPGLARALAVAPRCIVVVGNRVIRVDPAVTNGK